MPLSPAVKQLMYSRCTLGLGISPLFSNEPWSTLPAWNWCSLVMVVLLWPDRRSQARSSRWLLTPQTQEKHFKQLQKRQASSTGWLHVSQQVVLAQRHTWGPTRAPLLSQTACGTPSSSCANMRVKTDNTCACTYAVCPAGTWWPCAWCSAISSICLCEHKLSTHWSLCSSFWLQRQLW